MTQNDLREKVINAEAKVAKRKAVLLECEHIPADPPRRLHLPAL